MERGSRRYIRHRIPHHERVWNIYALIKKTISKVLFSFQGYFIKEIGNIFSVFQRYRLKHS